MKHKLFFPLLMAALAFSLITAKAQLTASYYLQQAQINQAQGEKYRQMASGPQGQYYAAAAQTYFNAAAADRAKAGQLSASGGGSGFVPPGGFTPSGNNTAQAVGSIANAAVNIFNMLQKQDNADQAAQQAEAQAAEQQALAQQQALALQQAQQLAQDKRQFGSLEDLAGAKYDSSSPSQSAQPEGGLASLMQDNTLPSIKAASANLSLDGMINSPTDISGSTPLSLDSVIDDSSGSGASPMESSDAAPQQQPDISLDGLVDNTTTKSAPSLDSSDNNAASISSAIDGTATSTDANSAGGNNSMADSHGTAVLGQTAADTSPSEGSSPQRADDNSSSGRSSGNTPALEQSEDSSVQQAGANSSEKVNQTSLSGNVRTAGQPAQPDNLGTFPNGMLVSPTDSSASASATASEPAPTSSSSPADQISSILTIGNTGIPMTSGLTPSTTSTLNPSVGNSAVLAPTISSPVPINLDNATANGVPIQKPAVSGLGIAQSATTSAYAGKSQTYANPLLGSSEDTFSKLGWIQRGENGLMNVSAGKAPDDWRLPADAFFSGIVPPELNNSPSLYQRWVSDPIQASFPALATPQK